MNWVLLSSSSAPTALPAVPPGSSHHGLTPNVLLIVIILTIIFFLSALLHLLVRFLVTVAATRYRDDAAESSVTALQGQLRQLFHLHDAGLDQSFIDNLPLFVYKAIIGSQNDPFDCAVCLCQFEPEDELRLIPRCNHAFHVECIDAWLLSHSTCPLCRANLLHDGFSLKDAHCPCSSPAVVVLESGSDNSQELGIDLQSMRLEIPAISGGFGMKDEPSREEKVMAVKLGKFRNLDDSEGSSCGFYDGGTNSVDGRRCFSMGSFAYVTDDTSALRVPIGTVVRKQPNKKPPLLVAPGHHLAMLVRNYESMREFAGFERDNVEINDHNSKCWIVDENETVNRGGNRKESFSVSKTWLRDKKERPAADSSRRACSFRLPITRNQETTGSELRRECDKEGEQSNCSGGSLQGSADDAHASSFARKTLYRILGRQNVKVVHSFENA